MALPSSRNTSYSPTNPLKSADLNAVQDCIIGAKHGDLTLLISPHVGYGTNFSLAFDDLVTFSGAGTWKVPLRLPVGKRLKSMTIDLAGNSAQTMQCVLRGYKTFPSTTTREAANPTHTPGAMAQFTTDFADMVVAAGEHWGFYFANSGSSIQLGTIALVIDHP
jgi:hypothetical protein